MLPSENKELVLRGAGLAYRVMWPRGGSSAEQSRAFMALYTMRDIAAGSDYRWNEKLTIHNLNLAGVIFDPNLPVLSPTNEGEPFLNPISGKGIRITYLSKTKYCASCSMSKQTCTCGGDTIIRLIPDSPIPKGEIQIIDDTVAGGGTMLEAMNLARGAGATKIKIVTVHGFFNGKNAAEAASVADRIVLSNTVTPKLNPDLMKKIEIFDVSKVITEYLSLILK